MSADLLPCTRASVRTEARHHCLSFELYFLFFPFLPWETTRRVKSICKGEKVKAAIQSTTWGLKVVLWVLPTFFSQYSNVGTVLQLAFTTENSNSYFPALGSNTGNNGRRNSWHLCYLMTFFCFGFFVTLAYCLLLVVLLVREGPFCSWLCCYIELLIAVDSFCCFEIALSSRGYVPCLMLFSCLYVRTLDNMATEEAENRKRLRISCQCSK